MNKHVMNDAGHNIIIQFFYKFYLWARIHFSLSYFKVVRIRDGGWGREGAVGGGMIG